MTEKLLPFPIHANDELDAILLQRGGLFLLEEGLQDWMVQMFQVIVARFNRNISYAYYELYKDKPRSIGFGFINDTSFNAFCYASPDGNMPQFDFIGINVGVLFTLGHVFNRMLAHPEIFPDVGDPKKEDGNINPELYLTTDFFKSEFSPVSPKCRVRAIFAGELTQVALDFLFFHEIAHLRNGHLEYNRNYLSGNTISEEVLSTSCSSALNMLRQSLEIDADCGAVRWSLNSGFGLNNCLNFKRKSNLVNADADEDAMLDAAYSSTDRTMRMVIFASSLIFRLFDITEWSWHLQPNYSHPFPPIRMFFIGLTMLEIFRTPSGYDNHFSKLYIESINEVEKACGLIQNMPPDARGIMNVAKNPRVLDYQAKFNASWQEMRPILEQYKRGGNLPE